MDFYIKPASVGMVSTADLPSATVRRMAGRPAPFALTAYAGISGDPAWKKIPPGT
ncbi:hypothetical protein [Nonomuraea sp. NPDC049607]|uniref:hypothetical protein n=1 Tax=Nonomuraea sp. NPDC049607 TaxID=3154732 RepID=UPI00341779C2